MMATAIRIRPEDVARQLFGLATQISLVSHPGRRRDGDLKELEYLTLAVLSERGTLNVGDIQRLLGVLPAQMSRIIRALEDRPQPLIACGINPRDKRRIDVALTPTGQEALDNYQTGRVHRLTMRLSDLGEDDREELLRWLDKLASLLEGRHADV